MNWAKKKVLVTGGSGFIGSHLVRRLVDLGADVSVTVKYNSVIDNVRLVKLWDQLTTVEADLRNFSSLAVLQQLRPQVIFHLAAYNHVGDSFAQFAEAISSNAEATTNLLEAYEGYERFVYTSTSEVYGFQEIVPFREDSTPFPLSPYAVGKYSGELYARLKHRSQGRPVAVIRPFNAYGPYQSARAIIPELILRCLTGQEVATTLGEQTRDFNFVANLVDGFLAVASHDAAIGEVWNVGGGVETPIRTLVETIHRLTGEKSVLKIGALPYRPGEIWRMHADSTRARETLGWVPKVDLTQGLEITVEWFRRYLAEFGDPRSPLAGLAI
ncbi:MAG: NAD-dependent epimerase/dehydratase family protein [Candidatus Binatia bacterium]